MEIMTNSAWKTSGSGGGVVPTRGREADSAVSRRGWDPELGRRAVGTKRTEVNERSKYKTGSLKCYGASWEYPGKSTPIDIFQALVCFDFANLGQLWIPKLDSKMWKSIHNLPNHAWRVSPLQRIAMETFQTTYLPSYKTLEILRRQLTIAAGNGPSESKHLRKSTKTKTTGTALPRGRVSWKQVARMGWTEMRIADSAQWWRVQGCLRHGDAKDGRIEFET